MISTFEYRILTPRTLPDLVDIEQELFELPQKVGAFLFSYCLTPLLYSRLGTRHL